MAKFRFMVEVETDTRAHADQVMAERLDYEEPYEDEAGVEFDYSVPYFPLPHPLDAVHGGRVPRYLAGPGEFALVPERLKEVLTENYEDEDTWDWDSPTSELLRLFGHLEERDALVRPEIGETTIELLIYDNDDEESCGFLVAVRPRGLVPWIETYSQVASHWIDTDEAVRRAKDGYDASRESMREAAQYVVGIANQLLKTLARLAPAA